PPKPSRERSSQKPGACDSSLPHSPADVVRHASSGMRYAAIAREVVHINHAWARVGILGHVQPVHFEAEGGSTSARDLLDLGRQGCRLAGAQIAIWGEYLAYPEYVVANGEDLQVAQGL